MARQFRYRVTALVLGGLIVSAPLLTNGTASAEQLEADDRHVSFGGVGMLGLSCGSRPSIEAMTVPASSIVRVVNQTGHDAQLRLAGSPKGTIPADGVAEVVFRRGTTAVLLTPDCAMGDDVLPMLITASPSVSAEQPGPSPVPANGGASVAMSKPAGSGSPSRTSAGSALPDSTASASRPSRTASKDSRRGTRRAAASRPPAAQTATTAADALPQGGVGPRIKVKPMRGTAGVGVPTFAGMPPGDRKTIVPPSPGQAGDAVPTAVDSTETAAEDVLAMADPTGPGSLDAAEPVAAVGRIEEGHPLGLLGLTALVCIMGVATAAIRAIVSQRASRTNMA